MRHFLPTNACPRVAFFFRAQCGAQSLHPGGQGRKKRGDLVGEQRLKRVEEGVDGPARQLGQLIQRDPGPLFGGHLVQYLRGINLKIRIGIAGAQERLTQCLPDIIVVPRRAFALDQPMRCAQETARRRFGPRQPHGDVVVFLKAFGQRLEQKGQLAAIGQHNGGFGQLFLAQSSNRLPDVLAFGDNAAAVDPVKGRRILRKAMGQC